MNGPVTITVLVEDATPRADLGAEHGLAYWIEIGARRVLFDTGQSDLLVRNAQALGIDLATADAIVLSHGHYDHTGGLPSVLPRAANAPVFIQPAAFQAKYSRHADGSVHAIGMPTPSREALAGHGGELVRGEGPMEIADGLYATGAIPRLTDYEDTGGAFYLDEACTRVDPLIDDQALYFQCSAGTVVLLGCAHAGVVNTLRSVRRLTGDQAIHAVIGGMHLHAASTRRLEATVEALRELEVSVIAPAHCTGPEPTALLAAAFPPAFRECHAGSRFVFD